MEPTGNGVGGDLFAIVWDADSEQLFGLNASGRSPRSLTLAEFQRRGLERIPPYGPLPVTVPGCVDGWFELHDRFGKLPMADILAPAIGYAREGFPVSELIAYYWQLSARRLAEYPNFTETFTRDGRAPVKGELWTNEALAHTLETIARHGPRRFLTGRHRPHHRRHGAAGRRLFELRRPGRCTTASGSNRFRPPTATWRSGSCRPTARASLRCRS